MPVGAGKEGVARGETVDEAILDQKIHRPIHRDRRGALAGVVGENVDHLIRADGATGGAQFVKDALARGRQAHAVATMRARGIVGAMGMIARRGVGSAMRAVVVGKTGPVTSRALRELGREPDVEAAEADAGSLVGALVEALAGKAC